MFIALRRKAAEDGYFLSTSASCNGQMYRCEDKVPTLERDALLAWLDQQLEAQRERVALTVYHVLRKDIEMDIAVAQRNGTDE